MLVEIWCDKFMDNGKIRPKVKFRSGLNTILGDINASNSIGKTTFLLIVDFAFGGDDYIKSDATRHILDHTICFGFEFESERFYFSRTTKTPGEVNCCDENYTIQNVLALDKYNQFLFEKYQIARNGITFRNIIGRYLRIYGRDNLNETKPLNSVAAESGANAITALLKLFGRYDKFDELLSRRKRTEDDRKALAGAIEFEYIPAAKNKTQYKNTQKQIEILESELSELLEKQDELLSKADLEQADTASAIKAQLASARRQRSRLLSQLRIVESNLQKQSGHNEDDIDSLKVFFPNANIEHINKIESFHHQLQDILISEFEEERANLQTLIEGATQEIESMEKRQRALGLPIKLSKAFLDKYSSLNIHIAFLKKQNDSYEKLNEIKEMKRDIVKELEVVEEQELRELQNDINIQMAHLNGFIYDGTRKPPILNLQSTSQYSFETPDDTGTGTSCKSMIVFDLSVLYMTPLPAIAHDSVILKNIGDAPIEKIMELYLKSHKQIFIALDKDDSYSKRTSAILNQTAVLRLSDSGSQLFGRAWNMLDA